MQNDGKLVFGILNGGQHKITTAAAYNNGQWHHVVGTQSAAGIKLYVDGLAVGTNPQATAQAYTGYWRVGGDTTWGSTSRFLNGTHRRGRRLSDGAVGCAGRCSTSRSAVA